MTVRQVLITGASGMLGHQVVEAFAASSAWQVVAVDRSADFNHPLGVIHELCDLTETGVVQTLMSNYNFDLIIHCAGLVNLPFCQEHPEKAQKLHQWVTSEFVKFQKPQSRLFYISTDSVFDGIRGHYLEVDEPSPLNMYAKTKLAGEKSCLNNPNNLVIRCNIYGFVAGQGHGLAQWLWQQLSQNQSIVGFTDVYFNPLYTRQLASILLKLAEQLDVCGVIHTGSKEVISKFMFACLFADVAGFKNAQIQTGLMPERSGDLLRPHNTALKSMRLEALIGETPTLIAGLRAWNEDFTKLLNKVNK